MESSGRKEPRGRTVDEETHSSPSVVKVSQHLESDSGVLTGPSEFELELSSLVRKQKEWSEIVNSFYSRLVQLPIQKRVERSHFSSSSCRQKGQSTYVHTGNVYTT